MKIRILSTSDVHGYLLPNDFKSSAQNTGFGYLKAASVIEKVRSEADDDEIVLYIENGDFIQGSPLTDFIYRTHQEKHLNTLFSQLANALHPDAAVLGNHEFNYGIDYIADSWKTRDFPILAANIAGDDIRKISDGPYTIIDSKGIKIAILGLTTQFVPNWEDPRNLGDLQFNSALKVAKQYVPKLKELADVVIVAYHGGFDSDLETGELIENRTGENEGYQLLQEVPGIDALVTGHQHREIADKVNGIPTTQPGYRGKDVGEITIELDANKQITNARTELLSCEKHPINNHLQAMVESVQKEVNVWLDQPIANINGDGLVNNPMAARLYGNGFLDLINRIQMDYANVDIAATTLFNNDIPGFNDSVSVRDVLTSYIFPNTLAVEEVSGSDLKAALERCASFFTITDNQIVVSKEFSEPKMQYFNYDYYSGIDYTFDLTKPVGQRVVRMDYQGKPVSDSQKLKVCLNQYRSVGAGDYDMYSRDKIIATFEDDMPKIIIDYLHNHQNIIVEQPQNLKIIK
ncbi:bifunctional metallophosphatase/5'-nucleotidase [Apilactobacillus apinorum]|uniref:Bifunctional UDP-sugar hydrolase/5'-nucleotidase n=1 Tax=Apilactobacillus apinorum TaxID=1218495 RepID=A0ABP9ZG61_9LACO